MNAINFSGFNPNTTWFSARRIIRIVPSGRTWDIVASPYSVFWLCLGRAQVRRHDFACIIANAVNYKFFDAAQARCAAARVALVAPWVGFTRNSRLYFYLIVVQSVPVRWSIRVIVASIGVGARLHEASFVVVWRLDCVAFAIVNRRNDFGEFQEDFAVVLSYADTFAARYRTWTPITCDESVKIQFSTLSHIMWRDSEIEISANSIKEIPFWAGILRENCAI